MGFKRKLRWLILVLIPLFLFTGCGDLEPDMQDTRTVILNMDFHGKSFSRSSSSVSASELSQYNTHLILALPSGEVLTSNYRNYDSSFAQGLMNTVDNKVSLEIPLNTQMKIFAFLFEENYSMSELFPGTREVGYYGESQSFSIGTQTNNLSLGVTLIQVAGTGTDTGGETGTTDTTAPTVTSVSTTANNQSSVSITDNITVIFSEAMDTTYITTSTSDAYCAGTIRVSSNNFTSCVKMSSEPVSSNSNKTFTLDPYDSLTGGTTYKTRVTTGVKDTAGNAMSSQYETSSGFTTSSSSSSSSSASSVTPIAAGGYHSCALLNNASVKCWGWNAQGQLGIDNTTDMGKTSGSMAALPSIDLGTGRTATAIAAGRNHSCALLDNASVKCWGHNGYGQLGIDNNTQMGKTSGSMAVLPSIDLGTGRTATAIDAGFYHNCALLNNASVKCWGENGSGQLGIDNTTRMGDNSGEMAQLTGIDLGTGRTATAIAAGRNHSCALLDNASVKCWGENSYGQLGIDNNTNMGQYTGGMAALPTVNLGTGRTATAIAAGRNHSCALLDNASVKCWGRNSYGQLGIDNNTNMGDNTGEMAQLTGIDLGTGRTATAIAAGRYHNCALLDNASVKCWGENGFGQLGIDNATDMGKTSGSMAQLTGINLGTGRTATAISAGRNHNCALLNNASVKCWGNNSQGYLGIDNTTRMGDNTGEMALLPSIDL